jgi:hypothetical protein
MGDGKALFHNDHKNIVSGGGTGAPPVESVSLAIRAMTGQKDPFGKLLSIKPKYFLAPRCLEAPAETFFVSEMVGTAALPTTKNIYAGRFTRIYDDRLDDISPTTWYLVGEKSMGVSVFYLRGQKLPYVELEQGFKIDGVTYKVRFDFGVKALSWRNFVQVKVA